MYRFETNVRYSEMADDLKVRPHQIINYFQDCSVLDSEEIDKGLSYTAARKRGWFLSAWQVEILEYPLFMQHISVGTWPYAFSGMYGYRNFDIQNDRQEQIVRANSLWCMVDFDTGMPVKVTEEDIRGYQLMPGIDMPEIARKLRLYKDGERRPAFQVRRNDIDTNHHVNNAAYIAMAEEYLPVDFLPDILKVQYRRAATYGQSIYPLVTPLENGFSVGLCDEAYSPYVIIEFLRAE